MSAEVLQSTCANIDRTNWLTTRNFLTVERNAAFIVINDTSVCVCVCIMCMWGVCVSVYMFGYVAVCVFVCLAVCVCLCVWGCVCDLVRQNSETCRTPCQSEEFLLRFSILFYVCQT